MVLLVGIKLTVATAMTWAAIALVASLSEIFVGAYLVNLRAALWLFLLEFAFGTYLNRKGLALSIASDSMGAWCAAVAVQSSQELWKTISHVTVNLLIRSPTSLLATSVILAWNGNDADAFLVHVAAVLPSIAYAVAQRNIKRPAEVVESPNIRGTHLGDSTQAQLRAAELVALAEQEMAGKPA